MRDLFAWQLVGDVLKVGAYVYGYLVIAKASLRFLYSDGNHPVRTADRILTLAYTGARRGWRGAGIYGHLYCLFRPL